MATKLFVFVVAALVVSAGVGVFLLINNEDRSNTSGDITVVDNRGKTVSFSESPKRIMALGSSFTDTLVTLGCMDQIFAVDQSSITRLVGSGAEYDGLTSKQPLTSGSPSTSTADYALTYGIDCVIVWNFPSYTDGIAAVEKAGVKVLALYPTDIGSVEDIISLLGKVMGKSDVASALIDNMNTTIHNITELSKTKAGADYGSNDALRVYIELDTASHTSPGTTTITASMLDMLGVNYISKFNGDASSRSYSPEEISLFSPNIMVFMGPVAPGYDVLRGGLISVPGGVHVDTYDNSTGDGFNGNWASATPSFIKGLVYLYVLIYGEAYEP